MSWCAAESRICCCQTIRDGQTTNSRYTLNVTSSRRPPDTPSNSVPIGWPPIGGSSSTGALKEMILCLKKRQTVRQNFRRTARKHPFERHKTTNLPRSRPVDDELKFCLFGCHLHSLLSFGWAWVGKWAFSIDSEAQRRAHKGVKNKCGPCFSLEHRKKGCFPG